MGSGSNLGQPIAETQPEKERNPAVPSEVVWISKGESHLATSRGCGQCKRCGRGLPCPIPEETRPEALRTQTHSIKVTTQGGHGRRKAGGEQWKLELYTEAINQQEEKQRKQDHRNLMPLCHCPPQRLYFLSLDDIRVLEDLDGQALGRDQLLLSSNGLA